jgi:hypothetical protein
MKGFFAFATVLAIISLLLIFSHNSAESSFILEQTENELIKTEEAHKERTLLENNVDKIVEEKLKEQIEKRNHNTKKALEEISASLSEFLKEKTVAKTIFGQTIGEVTKEFLNENSAVQIIKTKKFIYAEYTFTSNLSKTNTITADFGNEIKIEFRVPIGYSQNISAVKWDEFD